MNWLFGTKTSWQRLVWAPCLALGALSLLAPTTVLATPPTAPEEAELPPEEGRFAPRSFDTRSIRLDNNFTFNPGGIVFGGVSLGYDRGALDLLTIGVRGFYVAPVLWEGHVVGGELSLLFWPRHPNNGFFIGPLAQIAKSFPTRSTDIGVTLVAPGARLGWRWIWRSGFNLSVGGGLAWGLAVAQDRPCTNCSGGSGPMPQLQLDIGYAFGPSSSKPQAPFPDPYSQPSPAPASSTESTSDPAKAGVPRCHARTLAEWKDATPRYKRKLLDYCSAPASSPDPGLPEPDP